MDIEREIPEGCSGGAGGIKRPNKHTGKNSYSLLKVLYQERKIFPWSRCP